MKLLVFIPETNEVLVNDGVVCGEYDPNCVDCKVQRQVASKGCVSHNAEVWQAFEESIEQAEKGFSSWLLQSQAVSQPHSVREKSRLSITSSCLKPTLSPESLSWLMVLRMVSVTTSQISAFPSLEPTMMCG